MWKSERGSRKNLGKNVKQKGGLNRAMLDAGPFELRRQLQYNSRDAERCWYLRLRKTPAAAVQSAVPLENRKTQKHVRPVRLQEPTPIW